MDLQQLVDAIERVDVTGQFAVSGVHEQAPVVRVDGMGPLPLPVIPVMLPLLQAVGGPAPYGRGTETLFDASVRRCTQMDAQRVHVPDSFTNALNSIVEAATLGLGVIGEVRATLYKLLVYGPGDFFAPHRDTEKEDGMFATLVVTLPAESSGGDLVVRHRDRVERVSWRASDHGVQWAAFYADCLHEIEPLQHGVRVALVYNLVRPRGGGGVPDMAANVSELATLMRGWDRTPKKLAWLLEHSYSNAGLRWNALKGRDQSRAAAVVAAAKQADVKVYLAKLSVEQWWSAEVNESADGSKRRRSGVRQRVDASEVTLEEMYEDHCQLQGWINVDGKKADIPPLKVAANDPEVVPLKALQEQEPDELRLLEATGNEGASVERWYRRVALVLWPASQERRMIVARGIEAVAASVKSMKSPAEVRALVRAAKDAGCLENWSVSAADILEKLFRQGDAELAVEILANIRLVFVKAGAGLDRVLPWLPEEGAVMLVYQTMRNLYFWSLGAVPVLLAASRLTAKDRGLWTPVLDAAVFQLLDGPPLSAGELVIVAEAAWHFEHLLMKAWLLILLRSEETADALAEATHVLVKRGLVLPELVPSVRKWLDDTIASPPEAPTTWERAPIKSKKSKACVAVSRFLVDPKEQSAVFPLPLQQIWEVENAITLDRVDATTTRLPKDNPQKLVVTKNSASYERALKRHADRLTWRAGMPG